jgi:hypothetical protein
MIRTILAAKPGCSPPLFAGPHIIKRHKHRPGVEQFNQWLAGLIDGSRGRFLVNPDGSTNCEILTGADDERLLRIIQNKLSGGRVTHRVGVREIRYRMVYEPGMKDLVKRVNGHIRDPYRLLQLEQVCKHLDVKLKHPDPPRKGNGWFAGLFDADGHIDFIQDAPDQKPKLDISITTKHPENVRYFLPLFGGEIHHVDESSESQRGSGVGGGGQLAKWSLRPEQREDVDNVLDYFRAIPSHTGKRIRLLKVKEFYKLVGKGAYGSTDPELRAAWNKFLVRWGADDDAE